MFIVASRPLVIGKLRQPPEVGFELGTGAIWLDSLAVSALGGDIALLPTERANIASLKSICRFSRSIS